MAQALQGITEYLSARPQEQQDALERLRRLIRSCVPEAEECISYGIPAFCLDGKPLVAYGASKTHCALYPMDPNVLTAHLEELSGFETSKGTIRFQPTAPLPDEIVRKLVLARASSIRGDS